MRVRLYPLSGAFLRDFIWSCLQNIGPQYAHPTMILGEQAVAHLRDYHILVLPLASRYDSFDNYLLKEPYIFIPFMKLYDLSYSLFFFSFVKFCGKFF